MELVGYKVHMYYVYNFQYFFILQVQTFCNTVEFAVLFSPCNHMPYIYKYKLNNKLTHASNQEDCDIRGSDSSVADNFVQEVTSSC